MTCWRCHEPVGGVVCSGCGTPQPPPATLDPYWILGLKQHYFVDLDDVEQRYRALARKLHPDRFAGQKALERRLSLQWTALLNEARRVLKDPVRRARFLATGQAEIQEKGGPKLDTAFLTEMFVWREEEEETAGSVRVRATAAIATLQDELDEIFRRWEAAEGDLSRVPDRLARLKYLSGFLTPPP